MESEIVERPALANLSNEVYAIPKGNWTKLLKNIPNTFNDQTIHRHHFSRKSGKHKLKGYRMFKAQKVTNVLISHEKSRSISHVKSKVHASYTAKSIYSVHIVMDSVSGNIKKGACECKSGQGGVCSHVAATLWFLWDCIMQGLTFIPNDVSRTDIAQKWGKLNVKNNLSTTNFSILNFTKHTPGKEVSKRSSRKLCVSNYVSLPVNPSFEENKSQLEKLEVDFKSQNKRRMWQVILRQENHMPSEFIPITYGHIVNQNDICIDESLNSEIERLKLPTQLIHRSSELDFPESVKVTVEESRKIEEYTREQSSCQLWKTEKKSRVTTSHFGSIIKRKAKVTPQFVATVRGGVDISKLKYVREGLDNEATALQKYCAMKNNKVKTFKVGLIINPGMPALGTSPDGLIYDEDIKEFGLIEIKTLAKAKELGLSIDEAIAGNNLKTKICLKRDVTGKVILNRTHNYFYQVQGQLGITGLSWCDFFVDTGVDCFCERIQFNQELFFESMLPKLESFYFDHFLINV